MKAIILAGGLGTRLKKRLPDTPKVMAPISGRPFLEYLLDKLISNKIEDVVLSVGYKANVIESHFKKSYKGLRIQYAYEDNPLGTGGAIMNALEFINENSVLILNGDTLVDINYFDLHKHYVNSKSNILVVLKRLTNTSRYGSVTVHGDTIIKFNEKEGTGEGFINAGAYLISSNLFENYDLKKPFSFERDFLQSYCLDLQPSMYKTNSYFIDIGVTKDYERAEIELPKLVQSKI